MIPLMLFGASVLFLNAEANRTAARTDIVNTLERVADRVTVALQKEVEVAEALAALPSLDLPDLERFYRTAQRIAPQRQLWETVSLADVNGMQIMNILRQLGATLGPVSDRQGFDDAIRTKQSIIGGIGPIGPVSGKRLVSISTPVIRDENVRNVLTVGLSPAEIQGILRRAGAPKDWIGTIVDANGIIIARTQGITTAGHLASEAVRSAITSATAGKYAGYNGSSVMLETYYRRLPATNGWTVHFGIPTDTLNAPVSQTSVLLLLSCTTCAILAGAIAHFTARDLNARRRQSEELSALLLASSEARATVAIEAAELGTCQIDAKNMKLTGSARTSALMNLVGQSHCGRDFTLDLSSFFEAVHLEDRTHLKTALLKAAQTRSQLDIEFRNLNGHWIKLVGKNLVSPLIKEGTRTHSLMIQGVVADVHAVRTAQSERVMLLKRITEAQEEEQQRIARELHDQVGQTLTGLSLGLRQLKNNIDTEDLRSQIVWLETLTDEISRDIYRAAADLRPVALDDLGLARALSALASELSRRHAVLFDVQSLNMADRLPDSVEISVFRIVQEAFTNALKHADATTVSTIIKRREDSLFITIEDDGRGIPSDWVTGRGKHSAGKKLGLLGIRERLSSLGGSLRIETEPSRGTTLFIDVPLSARLPAL